MNGLLSKIKKALQSANELILRGKDQLMKNKKMAAVTGVIILILIAVVVFALKGIHIGSNKDQATVETVSDGDVSEEPLEKDAYPEVNALVENYYKALADGDIDTVVANRNYTEDTEKIRLEKKSEYIESYENITCYTKKGLLENTYLAYVYYEVKFKDIDTLAPALNTLYICPNESGELYIYEGEIDDNVSAYLKALSTQDDVLDLFNKVQVSYNEAIEKDPALNEFLTELPTKIKTEVGEALAALESTEEATTEEAATEEAATEENTTQEAEGTEAEAADTTEAETATTKETVEATDTVNVRMSDSETADKLGKAQPGDQFTRLEKKENGWSKILFEDQEAYVKSEYLQVVDAADVKETEEQADGDTDNTVDEDTPTQGKVTVKETVNVRKSANESSDKLGVAYQGDSFDLIMKQADGWSKIDYNGQTGYVKSEFVE